MYSKLKLLYDEFDKDEHAASNMQARDNRVLEKKLDELIALVGARESRALEAEHRILQLEEAVLRLQQQQQQQKRAAEAPNPNHVLPAWLE